MSDNDAKQENLEMWAVVSLFGHSQVAGVIRPSELGGLIQVDIPIGDGFRTEFFGEKAIFNIKVVSEEIARAYALPDRNIIAYDEPIVPRAEYEKALRLARQHSQAQENKIDELQRRLTAVNALPAPEEGHVGYIEEGDSPEEEDDGIPF